VLTFNGFSSLFLLSCFVSCSDALQFKMTEIESDQRGELAARQRQIDALTAQLLAGKQRVDRVEQIENFIINLCAALLCCSPFLRVSRCCLALSSITIGSSRADV
jgi:hypothetical protein